jgi:hypothetical protein
MCYVRCAVQAMSITLAEMEVAARDMQVAAEQVRPVCHAMLNSETLLQVQRPIFFPLD